MVNLNTMGLPQKKKKKTEQAEVPFDSQSKHDENLI